MDEHATSMNSWNTPLPTASALVPETYDALRLRQGRWRQRRHAPETDVERGSGCANVGSASVVAGCGWSFGPSSSPVLT